LNHEQTIRGYRIGREPRKQPKGSSVSYLYMKKDAAAAHTALQDAVLERGSNCLGRADEFSGDTLPSQEWAERECLGCPVFTECDIFRKLGRPSFGVFAGKVYGAELEQEEEK